MPGQNIAGITTTNYQNDCFYQKKHEYIDGCLGKASFKKKKKSYGIFHKGGEGVRTFSIKK